MSVMLLSINPQHVRSIASGRKRFEFRKVRARRNVDKIIIYSTAPEMAVVGEASVRSIVEGDPDQVWKRTEGFAGITRSFFLDYYGAARKAIAYELCDVEMYQTPKSLHQFGVKQAPQSFVYVG